MFIHSLWSACWAVRQAPLPASMKQTNACADSPATAAYSLCTPSLVKYKEETLGHVIKNMSKQARRCPCICHKAAPGFNILHPSGERLLTGSHWAHKLFGLLIWDTNSCFSTWSFVCLVFNWDGDNYLCPHIWINYGHLALQSILF